MLVFINYCTMDEQIPQLHTPYTTLRPIIFHYPKNTCCEKLQTARRVVIRCNVQHMDVLTKTKNSQN